MKLLWLEHPEPDYVSALTYLGLCEELGAENVIDWPYKGTLHGETCEGPHGLCSPCWSWFPPQPGRRWSDDEVFSRLQEFDLAVLASPRAWNTAACSANW